MKASQSSNGFWGSICGPLLGPLFARFKSPFEMWSTLGLLKDIPLFYFVVQFMVHFMVRGPFKVTLDATL